MIVHKGESFAGEHEPIIPLELWDAVQAKFKANASGTSRRLRSPACWLAWCSTARAGR